jgi:hypothetical protein
MSDEQKRPTLAEVRELLDIPGGELVCVGANESGLDGSFTAEQLRRIADHMDRLAAEEGASCGKEFAQARLRFVEEYAALCRRHGLTVESCGCCKSPWVIKATPGEIDSHAAHLAAEGEEKQTLETKEAIRRAAGLAPPNLAKSE